MLVQMAMNPGVSDIPTGPPQPMLNAESAARSLNRQLVTRGHPGGPVLDM